MKWLVREFLHFFTQVRNNQLRAQVILVITAQLLWNGTTQEVLWIVMISSFKSYKYFYHNFDLCLCSETASEKVCSMIARKPDSEKIELLICEKWRHNISTPKRQVEVAPLPRKLWLSERGFLKKKYSYRTEIDIFRINKNMS